MSQFLSSNLTGQCNFHLNLGNIGEHMALAPDARMDGRTDEGGGAVSVPEESQHTPGCTCFKYETNCF